MKKFYTILLFTLFFSFEHLAQNSCVTFNNTPIDKTQDCSTDPVFDSVTATDACCSNSSVNITFVDTENFQMNCLLSITRTWIATSSCGSETISQTINFVDNEKPVFVIVHPDLMNAMNGDTLTKQCQDGFFVGVGDVSATDNCDDNPSVLMYDEIIDGSCPNDGFTQLLYCYWIAEDACGNKDTFEIYVKYVDLIAPQIFCPDDVTIDCTDSTDPSNVGEPTAADNCSEVEDMMFMFEDSEEIISPCETKITRTWMVMDECGNEDTCEQIIWVVDGSSPEITCPSDITIDCDKPTDPLFTGMATATDACSPIDTITFSDETVPVSICEYQINRTWLAEDICENTSTCLQIVTVKDLTAPEITCPSDVSLECGESILPANTGLATSTDNCTHPADIIIEFADDSLQINSCELIIERTWTATDNCGNQSSCVQILKITDTVAPEIICPANVTIECTDSIDPADTGFPTANEVCDQNVDFTYIDSEEVFDCETVITRKWTATDDCGNATVCEQMITLSDFTAPEITCPDNITVECNDEITPDITGNPTATDNCDSAIEFTFADLIILDNNCEMLINRTWTGLDNCGNESSCSQLINRTDTTPPDLVCPTDITIECNTDTSPAATGEATGSDSCDDSVEITFEEVVNFIDLCTTTIDRTWTATNDCGLISDCVQIITVNDQTPPAILCPEDGTVECDAPNDPSVTGEPTATDNCDTDLEISFEDILATINNCESAIERTWSATDNCGNVKSCIQTIKVLDTTAPQVTCPADVTIECNTDTSPIATGEPTAEDNCSVIFDYTFVDANNPIDDCSNEIIRTWTANDGCDNLSTCDQTITITDTTAPEINCPQNQTVECNMPYDPSVTGEPFAFDNCDGDLDITFGDIEIILDDCITELTRTWVATDNCGNVMSCDQIITITDSTPPAIICPEDVEIECNTDYSPAIIGEPTATDNCDTDIEITFADVSISNDGCTEIVERTWTAIDNCGVEKTCIQTVTITDTTLPEITCPDDISINCDESSEPSNTGMPTASDNCDLDLNISFFDDTLSQSICQLVIDRKWTVFDNCENGQLCSQMITIEDTSAPIITCPADATIECDVDNSPFNQGFATATDNCSNEPTITWNDVLVQIDDCNSQIERTWTATDDCGNQATCIQILTITDSAPPVNTCPQHVTISCEDSTEPSNTGEPFAFDNCDSDIDITYNDVVTNDDGCTTITERTWSATDNCGNVSDCVQFITVTDSENPTITCPDDLMVDCDNLFDPTVSGEATATDNCDTDLTINYTDAVASQDDCQITYSRTWSATDNCGNVADCIQTINVTDMSDPEIECPADISISCEMSADPANTGMPTATDNCDMDLTITYTDDTLSQNACQIIIERKWSAFDDCENGALCSQMITIEDTSAPIITCPADATIECDVDNSPFNQGFATATDNCSNEPTITWNDVLVQIDDCNSQIERTWTATDDCGNQATCIQILAITDSAPPVNTCPQHVTISCEDSMEPSNTGEPFAFDNCDSDIDITYNDVVTNDDGCTTITERTWSATDNCGNVSDCVQFITVTDSENPIITCPDDLMVDCDNLFDPSVSGEATAADNCDMDLLIEYSDMVASQDGCQINYARTWIATDNCGNVADCIQSINVTDMSDPEIECPVDISISCEMSADPANTGMPTATDNCDMDLTITYTDDTLSQNACQIIIERKWSAMDDCDNAVLCSQMITIEDTSAPIITCPADATIECDVDNSPFNQGFATATDNCSNEPTITWNDVLVQIDDCNSQIERTWTATDDCGNQATCIQILAITDSAPPVNTCPQHVTISCEDSMEPSNTGEPFAFDNCDSDIDITYDDVVTNDDGCTTVTERTWSATDNCGNVSDCVQFITVTDSENPIITCPDDLMVDCDNLFDPTVSGEASATDNCDTDLLIEYSDMVASQDGCQINYARTWTATDNCGNVADCIQSINVTDMSDPEIECPADISISCEMSADPANTGMPTATDNCDMDLTITYTDDTLSQNACQIIIERKWSAFDDCENGALCSQMITIEDTAAPIITCPADATLSCNDDTSIAANGMATATDNCDSAVDIISEDETIIVDDCTTEIKRTFTATDDCGLMATCTQILTITDSETPVITCSGDVVIECTDDTSPASTGEATATDNCDTDLTITYDDVTTVVDDCTTNISRNWMTMDNCGNVAVCSQNITITDMTAPEITCPDNLVVNCGTPTDPTTTGEATGTDNCDMDLSITFVDSELPGACGLSITRTWMASDNCGNADMCVQTIEVTDTEIPTINCPQNITVECDDATDISVTGEPFAFDNCDPMVDISSSDVSMVIDDCSTEITRTWSAIDECNNEAICNQTITIADQTAPTVTCPTDITIECTMSAAPQITGEASATDNCDNDLEIIYSDDTTQMSSCNMIITRTWTAIDNCGNETDCNQVITVTDTNAPTISFNHPLLDNANDCDTLMMECGTVPMFTGADASATDICDTDVDISVEISSEMGDCLTDGYVEILTYNFIATDNCDNADTIKISIKTVDTTAPVITPIDPAIAGSMHGDTLVIDCENFWFLDESAVEASDACGNTTVVFEEEIYQNDCVGNGLKVTLACSWIATDECNNVDTFTLIMQVVDNTPPTLTGVPADISVMCADVPAVSMVTATDGCDGSPTLTFEETDYINSLDDCGIIREWTATDECGNTVTETQYITILDCDGCFTPNVAGFINFEATDQQDGTILLDWEFTAVSHTHLFLVQRSADNIHFQDIALVPGIVVLSGESDFYEYIDESPRRGNNYYRIKSVQANPSTFTSETRYIRMDEEDGVNILVYPNPTSNYLNVEIIGDLDKDVEVQVVNEFGQVVMLEPVPTGSVMKSLDLRDLPSGVYFVTVLNFRNRFVTHRIVKMD